MPRLFASVAGLCCLAPALAIAQVPNFTGTYATPNQAGGSVTLVLNQDAGTVTGTMSSAGVPFAINAVLEEGSVLGTMTGGGTGVYFSAEFDGARLMVTLFEAGPNNQPNYDAAQTIEFMRQGAVGGVGPLVQKPPAKPPSVSAAPTAPPASPASPAGGDLADWGISYQMPAGWQLGQSSGRVKMLASTSQAGAIFIAPGFYQDFNEIVLDQQRFYQTMNLMPSPVQQPQMTTLGGMQAMTATYASTDQMGQVVHGRAVALLTAHGTGFLVLGMTTPQQMPQLQPTVERLAASVRAGAPVVNQQAVAALAGRWMYYAGRAQGTTGAMGGSSRSYEETLYFDGRGNYQWQSSASVNVTTPGYTGGAGAGAANANSDQGTYTVIGSTLVVRGQRGQLAYQLQLMGDRFIAEGKTYVKAN